MNPTEHTSIVCDMSFKKHEFPFLFDLWCGKLNHDPPIFSNPNPFFYVMYVMLTVTVGKKVTSIVIIGNLKVYK